MRMQLSSVESHPQITVANLSAERSKVLILPLGVRWSEWEKNSASPEAILLYQCIEPLAE